MGVCVCTALQVGYSVQCLAGFLLVDILTTVYDSVTPPPTARTRNAGTVSRLSFFTLHVYRELNQQGVKGVTCTYILS